MKAIIPAAGLGTRFLPYTRSQPKEMLPIIDKPAIQYVVEEAIASGLHEILIITGRGKRAIEDHFDRNIELEQYFPVSGNQTPKTGVEAILTDSSIFYVRQKEHRGLGNAVLISEKYVGDESFSVLLGDDLTFDSVPCQKALIDIHRSKGVSVLAIQRVSKEKIGQYGMVIGKEEQDGVLRIDRIVEKPTAAEATSDLATLGRYVLTPSIFKQLRLVSLDSRGEIQLTNAIAGLLETEDVYAYLFRGKRYDIGDKVGWLMANLELALGVEDLRKPILTAVKDLSNFL